MQSFMLSSQTAEIAQKVMYMYLDMLSWQREHNSLCYTLSHYEGFRVFSIIQNFIGEVAKQQLPKWCKSSI
jgi:hypothetical protein